MSAESKDKAGFLGRLFKMRHAEESFWEPEPEAAEATNPAPEPAPAPVAEIAPEPAPEPVPEPAPAQKASWWARLRHGLARSSSSIAQGVADIFTKKKLSADMLEDLEDVLVRADLGVAAATRIAALVGKGRYDKQIAPEDVRGHSRR